MKAASQTVGATKERLIREAGRIPVERDTEYGVIEELPKARVRRPGAAPHGWRIRDRPLARRSVRAR
jgi:hypothetical protein